MKTPAVRQRWPISLLQATLHVAMERFSIGLATTGDRREGARLLAEQLEEHGIKVSIERLAGVLEEVTADPRRGFLMLARHSGRVVGVAYVAIIMSAEHCGPVAWLEELYVRPDDRHHGIGTALVSSVLERAQKNGIVAVALEIDAGHNRVISLYQRLGFHRLERSRWVIQLTE